MNPTDHSALPRGEDSEDLLTSLMPLLSGLWKYKWVMAGIVLLSMVVTFFWTRQQPRIYSATVSIEYDPNPARPLGREIEGVTQTPFYPWTSKEYFETQSLIIASRSVAERVANKLALHHDPDYMHVPPEERDGWKGATATQAARILQRQLVVELVRGTRIVTLSASDQSPERAALLTNAVADTYLEKAMEDRLGSTTSALEWLGKQLDTLKDQLEKSELALHDFTEESQSLSVPLEHQQTIVAAEIEDFNKSLTRSRMRRIDLSARLKELEAANVEDPLLVHASVIDMDPGVRSQRDRHGALQSRRNALAVELGDAHPKMQAVDAQLQTVRLQLREQIDGLIQAARSDLRESKIVETGLRSALGTANEAGVQLNLQEITYRRLERERDNTAKLYGAILERTAETDLTKALEVSYVRIVDRALQPSVPVKPVLRKNLLVGGVLGMMLGLAVAMLLLKLDRVIRSVEDAEALGLTILGIMPKIEEGAPIHGKGTGRGHRRNAPQLIKNRDLVVHDHPKSSVAECCRTIRTNLKFLGTDGSLRTIVVTSPSPREGKTTVSLSLAISLAQSGSRVLTIDTDLRKPRIHRALGLSGTLGVTSVLLETHSLREAVQKTTVPGLSLLASGPIPPNPSELLHSAKFQALIDNAAEEFDHVILDSPPLTAVTDAAIIAPQTGGVVMVVHGERTTREAVTLSLRQLRDVGARVIGGILNDVDLSQRKYGYGGYYYYYNDEGYYLSEDEEDDTQGEAPAAEA